VRGERDLVTGARVVKARSDIDDEAHLAAHRHHPADQAARMRRDHEVLHLAHSVGHQEARDQDIGVGEIELFGGPAVAGAADAEEAPRVGVQDRGEDAGRVKTRAAVPVNRPVRADECDGVQVADHPVVGEWAGRAPAVLQRARPA
jgi:hypothetical protein